MHAQIDLLYLFLVTYLHNCCPLHIEGVDKVYYNCSHSIQLNTHTKNYFTREPHPSEPNLHLCACPHELNQQVVFISKTEFNTNNNYSYVNNSHINNHYSYGPGRKCCQDPDKIPAGAYCKILRKVLGSCAGS